jgi:hypothetical protein
MKVPTYTAQTQRTNRVSGIQMTVQANANALNQSNAAITQVANNAAEISANWYKTELGNQRAAEVARAENDFTVRLQETVVQSKDVEAPQVRGFFDNQAKSTAASIASSITDTVSRKRFLSKAEDLTIAKRLSVLQDARARAIDGEAAAFYEGAETHIRNAASGNATERQMATETLFGTSSSVGLYQYMADAGYITQQRRVELESDARSQIDRSSVRQQLNAASISKDPANAMAVLQQLQDPANFKYLKPADRDSLTGQANTLAETLQRAAVAAEAKADTNAAKKMKAKQSANFAGLMTQVRRANEGIDGASLPNLLDVITMRGNQELTETQYKAISDAIEGRDAPATNTQVAMNFRQKIMQAETAEEIDEITTELYTHLGPAGDIKMADAISILSLADGAKSKTPEARDIKHYEGLLKKGIGVKTDGIVIFGNSGPSAETIERRNDALDTYHRLTTDPDDPIPPRQAYQEVLLQNREAVAQDLAFIAPSTATYSVVGKKDFSKWTKQDFVKAKISVRSMTTAAGLRLTPLQQDLEMETLQLLEAYMEEEGLFEGAPVVEENNQETGAGAPTVVDQIQQYLGGDDSIQSREDALANPQ